MKDRDKEEIGLAEIAGTVEDSDISINLEERNVPAAEGFVKQEPRKIHRTIH